MPNLTDVFADIFTDLLGTLLELAGVTVEGDLGYLGYTPPGGSYTVRDDSGYLWAVVKSGETRGAVLARNDGNVPASPGLPVEVVTQIIQGKPQAVIKGSYPLLGDLFLGSSAASAGVGSHTHNDPSSELYDPVGEARLKPGLLAPYKVGETYTLRCQVLPFTITVDGADIFVPRLLTPDLTSYVPGAGLRRLVKVGVRLSDLTVVVAAGSTEPASLAHTDDQYAEMLAAITFDPGDGRVKTIDGVKLLSTTTAINHYKQFVRNARSWLLDSLDAATAQYNAAQLQSRDVAATAPTDGQALVWDDGAAEWAPGDVAGAGGGHEIQDNGTPLTQRAALDFVDGGGIAWLLADDSLNDATEVGAELDIAALTEEAAPVAATSYVPVLTASGLRKTALDDLPAGSTTDAAAIHTNQAGEIAALTAKATPVSADLLIIEDSEASNVKKKVQVGSLGGGTTTNLMRVNLAGSTTTEGCSRTGDSSSSYSQAFSEIIVSKPVMLHQVIADIAAAGTYHIEIWVGPRGSAINSDPLGIVYASFGSATVAGQTLGQAFDPAADILLLPGVYCIGLVRSTGTSIMAVSSGEATYTYSYHANRGIATSASRIPFRLVAYPGSFELVTG